MTDLKLFGTDGVRGVANSETMNTEIATKIGRAAAYYVKDSDEIPQIVIGKDTRLSGYMIETALASGITSMGLNVIKTGPLPSPGVGFICKSMRARLGIVISASHNPWDQNGIKIFGHDGFKLDIEQESAIETLIDQGTPEKHLAPSRNIGKITQVHDSNGRYIQYLKERFPHRLNLRGIRIELDCANGAAYTVAPSVLEELGADIRPYNANPSGYNINEECGALHPERICTITGKSKANIGITLDGDADRVLLSDENGNLVDGDAILYISAKHLHSRGHLGQSTVVGTVMTNLGLDAALKREGISLVRTEVGDHNVISYMKKNGINLGGETCGHLIYLHHSNTGDGLLAALRILSIMKQQDKPLSELVKGYKPYPQKTINVVVKEKIPFDNIMEITDLKRSIDNKLKERGRSLLRYSGTEMVARITVESDDAALTDSLVDELANIVREKLGA
ncbi:MAG: phosphoglucosamine mutase [Deltaproteobacteria bacterium]|nr:phosphoglucosamine mutase [Deltaproteobacteria bacterium]